MEIKLKHKLEFKKENKPIYMGDVVSLNDSSSYYISSNLFIEKIVKFSDYPTISKNDGKFIYFADISKDRAKNCEVEKLYNYLTKNPDKVIYCFNYFLFFDFQCFSHRLVIYILILLDHADY
jgi:hypothetical protein